MLMMEWIRRVKRAVRPERGVSLIEIVLIIVIIGIAAVPLSRLSIVNQTTSGKYGSTTRAIFYAEQVMEQLISDYAAVDADRGYDWVNINWPGSTLHPPSGLSGNVTISAEDTLNGVPYVIVQITVSGTDITDVTLETWLVDND